MRSTTSARSAVEDVRLFFKIDCYDTDERQGSSDPADPDLTSRCPHHPPSRGMVDALRRRTQPAALLLCPNL